MQRPTAVTVFGVLNIGWGLFSLFGNVVAGVMIFFVARGQINPMSGTADSPVMLGWMGINLFLGTVANIALVVAGIGLLYLKPWARKVSLGYAVYAAFAVFVGLAVQAFLVLPPIFEEAQRNVEPNTATVVLTLVATFIGSLINLIYPALLWYFMTRPAIVMAFEGRPAAAEWTAAEGLAPRAASDNPYYSPLTDSAPLVAELPPGADGTADGVIGTLIPSKNGPALAAYYLGLFSLFPCMGFPLGVAAVYYGIRGLRLVRQNPAVRGGAHAWVGVICGGVFGFCNFVLLALAAIGMVAMLTEGARGR